MGASRSHSEFFLENHLTIALNQYCYFGKVVNYYDLSVLSMSVMDFPKNLDGGGWVG